MPEHSNGGYAQALEGHEERLQRVEATLNTVSVRCAEIGTKQDFMAQKLESGLGRIEGAVGKLVAKVQQHDARLEPLETAARASDARLKFRRGVAKKVVVGALLAATGVFATKTGEWLWVLLGN